MERSADGSERREREAVLGRLLLDEDCGEGVIFVDEHGIIEAWSAAAQGITGWSSEDVVGRPYGVIFTEDDRAIGLDQHELETARATGRAEDERWHCRADTSLFWGSGSCLAYGDPLKPRYLKIFRDSTHLRLRSKAAENEIVGLRSERQAMERRLAATAHELRDPLAPLANVTALLKVVRDVDAARAMGPMIERQVVRLRQLVEDLVDVSRARAGKLRPNYVRVELQALLRESVDECLPLARAASVSLAAVLPPEPSEIEVDPVRVQQIFSNLLRNAIKFSRPGGNVWLITTVDDEFFVSQIRDVGAGIGPEMLPRIFEMFTQSDESHTERGAGLGVGLAVAKEIVSAHGGTIEVRSDGLDKGSEFIVRLPIRPSRGQPPGQS